MLHFHTNVFAQPVEFAEGPLVELRGLSFATLVASTGGPPLFSQALGASFEAIQQSLLQIPRMDVEPDGYFLIAGGESEKCRWQVDGHMFEYDGLMHRVEIKGSCKESMLDQLLATFGWPDCALVFQLVNEGITLCEDDFRRFAATPPLD